MASTFTKKVDPFDDQEIRCLRYFLSQEPQLGTIDYDNIQDKMLKLYTIMRHVTSAAKPTPQEVSENIKKITLQTIKEACKLAPSEEVGRMALSNIDLERCEKVQADMFGIPQEPSKDLVFKRLKFDIGFGPALDVRVALMEVYAALRMVKTGKGQEFQNDDGP
ncbi:MAG: hypothetical protein Q9212_000910 [Teloschistes hypoglaucus]